MRNVIYKDDQEYPSLLRKIGKDAPKQIYFKMRSVILSQQAKDLAGGALATTRVLTRDSSPPLAGKNDKRENAGNDNANFDTSIFDNCLAVVGSRKLTHYGEQAIERIVVKKLAPPGGDDILIFVEVRTKRSNAFVSPEESINYKKLKKLYWNAENYIGIKKYKGQSRIDAICIVLDAGNNVEKLEHYKGI